MSKGRDSLAAIERDLRRCRCPLARTAHRAVPGEGPEDAEIVLVGQAPGRTEDQLGRPFIGRAGRYLDRMLQGIGLDRRRVFITSIEKHHPPTNRMPRAPEIEACLPFLERQLRVVQPRVVVALGRLAERTLGRIPGPWTLISTVHPASAMRFPIQHRRFARDLRRLRSVAPTRAAGL